VEEATLLVGLLAGAENDHRFLIVHGLAEGEQEP
jgi:hypothetical protein